MGMLTTSQARLVVSLHPGASAIWTAGPNVEAVDVSRRYCDLLQRTLGEIKRERWEARALPEDVPDCVTGQAEARERGQASRIVRYTIPGGGVIRLRATGVPIYDGELVVGYLTSVEPMPGAAYAEPRLLRPPELGHTAEGMPRSRWKVTVQAPRKQKGERYYVLRAYAPSGSGEKDFQQSSKTTSEVEARIAAADLEAKLNGSVGTFPGVVETFLRHKASEVEPSTLKRYRESLARTSRPHARRRNGTWLDLRFRAERALRVPLGPLRPQLVQVGLQLEHVGLFVVVAQRRVPPRCWSESLRPGQVVHVMWLSVAARAFDQFSSGHGVLRWATRRDSPGAWGGPTSRRSPGLTSRHK